jgi:hypothetical protein
MDRLRTPLFLTAIYILLLGFSTLSPAIVRAVFGYEVRDPGILLVLSAAFWGSGMLLWGIAAAPEKHGALAWAVVFYLVIFIAFLLLGWARGLYTVRNVGLPLVIDVMLAAWIGSVKPRS